MKGGNFCVNHFQSVLSPGNSKTEVRIGKRVDARIPVSGRPIYD